MTKLFTLKLILICTLLFTSCQTTETIVESSYKPNKAELAIYSAETFFFKNYTFTLKDGNATLVYQQDKAIKKNSPKIYLNLKRNSQDTKYPEYTDKSNKILVRVISDYEVVLQLDKTRHTLYAPGFKDYIKQDTQKLLADIAIWRHIIN